MVSMPLWFYYRIILICVVLASCGTTPQGSAAPTPFIAPATATLTPLPAKTNGFDPNYDGFAFRNYGFEAGVINMLPADVLRLFGPVVCIGEQTDPCTLIPVAQVWMQEINRAMQTGHCEGMAVLSQYFYHGILSPDSFGALQTADLTLVDNPALQREIAYWWATQATYPTRAHRTIVDAKSLLKTLARTLDADAPIDELFTVGMYERDFSRGHTVTPIGMYYTDRSRAVIELYDNNIPGEVRQILVDTSANSWSYTAPNVDGTIVTYTGDATSKNLELTAAEPRMEQQICHFCPSNPTVESVEDFTTFFFSSSAVTPQLSPVPISVYFVDALKRRVGVVLGVVTNEIPGATVSFLRGAESAWSPLGMPSIAVPPDIKGSLSITGVRDTPINVSAFGQGVVASIQNLDVDTVNESALVLDSASGQVVVASATSTQPDIVVGYTGTTQHVTIVAADVPLLPGGKLALQADLTTNAVSVYGSNPAPIQITTSRRDNAGTLTEVQTERPATDSQLATILDAVSASPVVPAPTQTTPDSSTIQPTTPIVATIIPATREPSTTATPLPVESTPTIELSPEPIALTDTPSVLPSETPIDTQEPTPRRPTRAVVSSPTSVATATSIPITDTPRATSTMTPFPTTTHTATPVPPATKTPSPAGPTDTPDPLITVTDTPLPTATAIPTVPQTLTPSSTKTPLPTIPPTPTPWWCEWSNLCFRGNRDRP